MFDATPWIRITALRLNGTGRIVEHCWKLIRPGHQPPVEAGCEPDYATAEAAAQRRGGELGLGHLRVELGNDGIWVGAAS
jgi:hypothetical protein